MNFIEQEFIPKKVDKSKRTLKILLILIILIVISIIAIIFVILALKKEPLKITLNGEINNDLKSIIEIAEDGTINIPIREIAPYLDYNSYNGDYFNKSENVDKCYVEIDEEVAVFTANSNRIEKINPKTSEATYYLIKKPIQLINGKLYADPEGIMEAFNIYFAYNKSKNKIIIETMDYIVESYKDDAIEMGYKTISQDFNDQKASLEDLVIIIDSKGKYGILNMQNKKEILETKYDKIKYVPESGEFTVVSNGKMGLKDSNGKDKIRINYQDIDVVSQESKLYVVKLDDKYGVINSTEDSVIPIIYDEIGTNIRGFEKNQITNKYVLLDEIIPVLKDDKWGFFKTDGTQITDYKYDSLGCKASRKVKDADSVLTIPEHNLIVAQVDDKYVLVNEKGKEIGKGIGFDDIYMITVLGKTTYYVKRNDVTVELDKVLDRLSETTTKKKTQETTNKTEENTENNNQEDEQQNSQDNNQDSNE